MKRKCTSSSRARHGAPKANDRFPYHCCTVGGCYKVPVSATTRVDTPHLGSAAASSEHIPWSIDRMASQDSIPSAPVYGVCELIWDKELRRSDRQTYGTYIVSGHYFWPLRHSLLAN